MENLNFIIILLAHQHIVDFVKNLYLLTFNTVIFQKIWLDTGKFLPG